MEWKPIQLVLVALVISSCARSPLRSTFKSSKVQKPQKVSKIRLVKGKKRKKKAVAPQDIQNNTPYNPTDPTLIAGFKNDEPQNSEDVVKIKQSATQKKGSGAGDDLVFFDYGKKREPAIKKEDQEVLDSFIEKNFGETQATPSASANQLVSNNVENVIAREMQGLSPSQNRAMQNALDSIGRSQLTQASQLAQTDQITIKPFLFNLGQNSTTHMKNYQILSSFDHDQFFNDDAEGEVPLPESIVGDKGEFHGVIVGTGFVRTHFSVPLGEESSLFEIPVPNVESIAEYLEKNKLEGYGAMLMVEKAQGVVDVDVDHDYEYRLLLDSNMKEVKSLDQSQYIFFLGLQPGNTLIKYLFNGGDVVSKISLMVPEELVFDRPSFREKSTRVISFYQENTLGKALEEMDLDIKDLGYFDQKLVKSKVGINAIKVDLPKRVVGSPHYLRLNYLNDDVFFGVTHHDRVIAPSREYLVSILDAFKIKELANQCLIQVNFNKVLKNISYRAESEDGGINTDLIYLDQDGLFRDQFSPLSTSLFILGYEQGRVSIQLQYTDDSTELIHTYCTDNTYLVEHR